MLQQLILNNLPSNSELPPNIDEDSFVMSTCQRVLVLSYGENPFANIENETLVNLYGNEAYSYLLEIICGLKSKLIGENEIVGQFKSSYKDYVQGDFDSRLLQILEKLFKDAKDIRSNYLIGLSQKTYASIARRKMVSKLGADHVVILGSGQLAEDLINQFKKKINVSICARNTEKVYELAKIHELNIIPWENKEDLIDHAFIVNSIGATERLFSDEFFTQRDKDHNQHLFIDLGSPSIVDTKRTIEAGFMSLDDVFKEGAIKEEKKRQQVQKARMALRDVVTKRSTLFAQKITQQPLKSAYV